MTLPVAMPPPVVTGATTNMGAMRNMGTMGAERTTRAILTRL